MKSITKEIKIALAAICAIALLIYGINFLKGINIFQRNKLYYVTFQDISGLAETNPVYANGYRIGTVQTIEYDYKHPGNVYVGIEIQDRFHITQGSHAELDAQMLGGVTMNIVIAQSPVILSPGDTIPGGPHIGALEQAASLMPHLQTMMPKLDSILTKVNTLVGSPAMQQTLDNTAALTQELRNTNRTINTLIAGDITKMADNMQPATQQLQSITSKLDQIDYAATVGNINKTMADLQDLTQNLNSTLTPALSALKSDDNTLGLLINSRQLYDNLNSTLFAADTLLNNLREHPKRYVHFSIFGKKDK